MLSVKHNMSAQGVVVEMYGTTTGEDCCVGSTTGDDIIKILEQALILTCS